MALPLGAVRLTATVAIVPSGWGWDRRGPGAHL